MTEETTECDTAMNAAITRALDYCGDEEKQADALGRLLGVDTVDESKHLETPPKNDPMEQRRWVASRAHSKIQTDGGDPYSAVEAAWQDLAEESPEETEVSEDVEPEPESEASDQNESADSELQSDESTDETNEENSEGEFLDSDDILTDA